MNPAQNRTDDGNSGKQLSGLRLRRPRGLLWLLLAFVLALLLWGPLGPDPGGRTEVSYSEFRAQLEAGNISRVTVQGDEIRGRLDQPARHPGPEGGSQTYREFVTYVPSFGDEGLMSALEAQDVEIRTEPASDGTSWWVILINVAPFLLLIYLGWIFFRRAQSQGQSVLGMRKSGAKPYDKEDVDTRFGDVAGAAGPKRELEEIIEFLRNPERFGRLGGEIPRGVLLVGPPGTGKTLLARAVAGEADVPFFQVTGSDFMEMLVGVGASRVRDLFKEAKATAPAIIFIDELDSIGRRRGAGLGGGHDEREQTLNQLLSEMDGFDPNEGVIVMAATNRPDILDPALLRPGRFDRRITVDLPTKQDRLEILRIHARDKPLADDVDLEEIARSAPGFSGADLENLLNESALLAAREEKDRIERSDIEAARDKILMGLERESLALTEDEQRLLAYHESGHAVVAALLSHTDPIHKVTIVPRGQAMGVTQQLPEKDKYLYERPYLLDRLAVMMGGRAAEELVFDDWTSGAAQDLSEATGMARKMVLEWGMSEEFGHVALGGRRDQVFLGEEIAHRREYSEATAREVDQAVERLLDEAYARATETLREHRDGLDDLASALVEEEEIDGDRVLEILGVDRREAEADGDEGPPAAAESDRREGPAEADGDGSPSAADGDESRAETDRREGPAATAGAGGDGAGAGARDGAPEGRGGETS